MKPTLTYLFGTAVPSYFALLIVGFLLATMLGVGWARRIRENPDVIVDLGLSMLVFGVLGARLLHVLADGYFGDYVHLCTNPGEVLWKVTKSECTRVVSPDAFGALLGEEARALGRWDQAADGCRPTHRDCFAWARFWSGGLTYYGGLMAASVAAWWLLRRDRFPFLRAADMAGMAIPVGLVCGRLGCLLGGCCFGRPLDGPLGLVFPPYSPASDAEAKLGQLAHAGLPSLAVHPTQLYESLGAWLLAALLVVVRHPRKRFDGQLFLEFLGGYALLRFFIEFLRADDRGGIDVGALWSEGQLSTSQWLGVLMVFGVVLAYRRLLRSAELRAEGIRRAAFGGASRPD